jgi:hypothetical protein
MYSLVGSFYHCRLDACDGAGETAYRQYRRNRYNLLNRINQTRRRVKLAGEL